jgi:3-oxoadipate enol-lactonase
LPQLPADAKDAKGAEHFSARVAQCDRAVFANRPIGQDRHAAAAPLVGAVAGYLLGYEARVNPSNQSLPPCAASGDDMPFLTHGERKLHYVISGAGHPVVLIHGFTNAGMAWMQQVAVLTFAGYQVVVPDLCGHGLSDAATDITTVDDLAGDLIALLDHLEIDCATICGLSLGGMVAMQLALDHPQRVDRLIIANSQASFAMPELGPVVDGWLVMFAQPDGPLMRFQATWPVMLNAAFRDSAAGRAAHDSWCRLAQRTGGASLSHVALGMRKFDVRDRLGQIAQPTLVIAGGEDKLFPLPSVRAISDAIPNARFELIAEAAHISSLDSPDAFNRLLLSALDDRVGASRG